MTCARPSSKGSPIAYRCDAKNREREREKKKVFLAPRRKMIQRLDLTLWKGEGVGRVEKVKENV